MRYLAIDLGDRRTGLAIGDDGTGVVSPLEVLAIPTGAALLDAIVRVVDTHAPDALVVGLPLNMDGTEGPRAQISRATGATLAERTGLPVHFQDERLTSDAAARRLAQHGGTRKQKKARHDAWAAAEFLRDFLGEKR